MTRICGDKRRFQFESRRFSAFFRWTADFRFGRAAGRFFSLAVELRILAAGRGYRRAFGSVGIQSGRLVAHFLPARIVGRRRRRKRPESDADFQKGVGAIFELFDVPNLLQLQECLLLSLIE